ncbi:uncharacterized protein ARMOST_16694 [Armillaria ostoyae]|uniref:Uncharacterized protein n=1 Tax=Armillaria ostoyae TaxID=47428 RepID=A0A284RWY7_ARMOS|nr:uncharacterized protein ARMOST_16694 [Armillaria ostoyae]
MVARATPCICRAIDHILSQCSPLSSRGLSAAMRCRVDLVFGAAHDYFLSSIYTAVTARDNRLLGANRLKEAVTMRERAKEQYDMELRDKGYRLWVNMRCTNDNRYYACIIAFSWFMRQLLTVYVGEVKRGMVLSESWFSHQNNIAARAESKLALYSD